MTLCIRSGDEIPRKILADNSGEFANEEYRDMCENRNVVLHHTAADNPSENGLCERSDTVIDSTITQKRE